MLITELLAGKPPDKICLIHGNNSFTYGALDEASTALARRLGINKGARVLADFTDPLRELLYFFAIIKAGGVCILPPADPPTGFIAQIMRDYDIQHKLDHLFAPAEKARARLPAILPTDIFLGALTSGSSGRAKLLWRDQQSWVSAFPHQSTAFSLSGRDTLFLTGSLSFTANLNCCLHLLFAGGTVVFSASQRPRGWLAEIKERQVTALFMVPANYRILLKNMINPLPLPRSILSGTAKLDAATALDLQKNFPRAVIHEYYGSAELGHISYLRLPDPAAGPFNVGRPFPGVEISIRDDVIWARSPYIIPAMRPQATVGDIGRLAADGSLDLFGRGEGIINSGGVKINAAQLEHLLSQHPGVQEAAVLAADDRLRGQQAVAFIVAADNSLNRRRLASFCRQRLDARHCPRQYFFLAALPLNANGKIDKLRLKDMLEKETIKKLLPQSEPFLFLDRLDTGAPGIIRGRTNYLPSCPFAQPYPGGGFYLPPVILIEALAQCGGAGARQLGLTGKNLYSLAALDKVKIHGQALLPAAVEMSVYTKKAGSKLLWQSGEARLDDKLILTAEWKCLPLKVK